MSDQKNNSAYWEVIHSIYSPLQKKEWDRKTLISAASGSEVHLSGWPIGVVLNRDDAYPKSTNFGIKAEIKNPHMYDEMFDYWELHKNGHFYFMRNLEEAYLTWEGKSTTEYVFNLDTRIVRTAEALLHCQKLYQILEVDPKQTIHFHINYYGLRGRVLSIADRRRMWHSSNYYKCGEDSYEFTKICSLDLIAADLKGLVYEATKELFELFNWFSYKKEICDNIVDDFLTRRL